MITSMVTLLASGSGGSGAVPWWTTVLVAVVPLSGAVLAYRQATKATTTAQAIDSKKVDAEAYVMAKTFYEDVLAERKAESASQQAQILQLNEHIIVLQKSLNEMQVHLNTRLSTEAQLREQIERLGRDLTRCATTNDHLSMRVNQLETALRDFGEPVPAPTT